MKRPELTEIPLDDINIFGPGKCTITMSEGQWDALLAAAYENGWTLLELDEHEILVKTYRRSAS